MQDPGDDIQFQILEHLRALREELALVHRRIEHIEQRLTADEKQRGQRKKT